MPRRPKHPYKKEYADIARGCIASGVSVEAFCKFLGVHKRTFDMWRKKYPEFEEAIKDTGFLHAKKAKASLLERANGCTTKRLVEKTEYAIIRDPETGLDKRIAVKAIVTKEMIHHPPDTQACMMILNNNDPGNWQRANKDAPEERDESQVIERIEVIGFAAPGQTDKKKGSDKDE